MRQFAFIAGDTGPWRIVSTKPVQGMPLPVAGALDVVATAGLRAATASGWVLYGLISNVRYATRGEVDALRQRQEPLGRPAARLAALIPIKKTDAWWALAQDERRQIFEEQSRHTAIGLGYLPSIARQLYHCRDLGEPFDFLTWFEYAPEHASAFEDLVGRLRETFEWRYVEREIDVRLEATP